MQRKVHLFTVFKILFKLPLMIDFGYIVRRMLDVNMLKFIFKRLLVTLVVLWVIVTITFFLMRLAPGGPFDQEKKLPPKIKENIEEKYGLNDPLYWQYLRYLGNTMRGDLGPSYKYLSRTVNDLIAESFPVSLQIGVTAMFIALIFGTLLGFTAALNQNSATDYSLMSFAVLGISVPNMVLGPLLAVWLGIQWDLLPVSGWEGPDIILDLSWLPFVDYWEWRPPIAYPEYYVLPVLTLSVYYIAIIARIARGSMLEVIRQEYIQTARSKGLDEDVIIARHALKGALLPVVSYCGPASAFIVTGSIVIEKVFAIPGMGLHFVQGATNRDYPLVMGTVIVVSVLVLGANLLVDIIYGFLDPRIEVS